jgi:hypothetical protein
VHLQAAADASQALSKVAADLSVLEDMDLGQLIAQVGGGGVGGAQHQHTGCSLTCLLHYSWACMHTV